jgi:hypothetical protein
LIAGNGTTLIQLKNRRWQRVEQRRHDALSLFRRSVEAADDRAGPLNPRVP